MLQFSVLLNILYLDRVAIMHTVIILHFKISTLLDILPSKSFRQRSTRRRKEIFSVSDIFVYCTKIFVGFLCKFRNGRNAFKTEMEIYKLLTHLCRVESSTFSLWTSISYTGGMWVVFIIIMFRIDF